MKKAFIILCSVITTVCSSWAQGVQTSATSLNYKTIVEDCTVIESQSSGTDRSYFGGSEDILLLCALCQNDVPSLMGRGRMDELDRHVYMQSEDYKKDKAVVEQYRNKKYAIVINSNSLDEFSFRTNGFSTLFPCTWDRGMIAGHQPLVDYIQIGNKLLFPVTSGIIKNNREFNYTTNDIESLLKVKNIPIASRTWLIVLQPNLPSVSDYAYIVNPIGLYLFDKRNGEILMDLKKCIRKPNTKIDNQKIKQKAQSRLNSSQTKQKSQHYCSMCGGKGYKTGVNMGGVKGKTTEKCITCGGTGYVYY